jgi:hypothetical protein
MKRLCILFAAGMLLAGAARAQQDSVEATLATGEKVRLFPNGRWEYADQKKAEVQRKAVEVEMARERSAQGTLGSVLGIGRPIYEGDKDFNRGSLNPKMR